MPVIIEQTKPGYVLLITVLTVGIITSTVAIAILLLGLSIERNAYSLQVSTQAYEFTMSCIERAIDSLRNDLDYEGNEQITLQIAAGYGYGYGYNNNTTGVCTIRPIGGFWNNNRTICVEATYGNYTKRRQEVVVDQVLPDTIIESWEEVPYISLCESYSPLYCGNSSVETGESCDEGGDTAACNANCTNAICGDGYTNTLAGEACDTEGESAVCDLDCSVVSCGDGYTNSSAGEECDSSGVDTATCNIDCTLAVCGDGYINTAASETCDGDGAGTGGETASCDSDCTAAVCGDGIVNITAGEECDGGAGCTASCTITLANSNEPTDYVAYWRLEESSGDAYDDVNSYLCTEKNGASVTTVVPSQISNSPNNSTRSRDFDGVDDYLQCENNSVFSPEPITVAFWVRSDEETQNSDGIICATSNNWDRGWGFIFESNNEISFFVQDWWDNYASASINPEGNWNHIIGSWDGSTIKIYVNGVLGFKTDTYNGSLTYKRLEIGRCTNDNYNLNGQIDDVRIYNRILTADEITALATGT